MWRSGAATTEPFLPDIVSGRERSESDAGRERSQSHVFDEQVRSRIELRLQGDADLQGRRPLSVMTWPEDGSYFGNVLAGIISGLKICLGMVVFANIVFNTSTHPRINEQFSTGVNLNLMAASITLSHSAIFSSMNALVAPQDVPSMLLGQLGHVIESVVEDDDKVGHTLMAAGWICALIIAAFAFLLGKLHAGTALRKLPAPVIGGFIAAMGALGIRSSLSTLTGANFYILWPTDVTPFHDPKTWFHLALSLYAFFSIRYLSGLVKPYIKNKSLQAIASPICLLSPVIVMYLVLWCRGQVREDLAWMLSVGWMYPPVASKPFYTMWQESYSFSLVDWNAFLDIKVLTPMLVLSALTSLSGVLSIVGTIPVVPCDTSRPGGVGGEVDLDRELVLLGTGQVASGLLTGFPGYQQVALSRNMVLLGGSHRLAEFVAAGFVFCVFVSGVPVAGYIPKYFLSAVFFNLGFDFCKTYLYDSFGIMGWKSYMSMIAIVLVALWKDLSIAVGVGILMQAYLMVSMASRMGPVYQVGSFDAGFISSRVRPWQDACRLRWFFAENSCHNKLEFCRLHGPIFFGNAAMLEQDVEKLIRAARASKPACTHFILDMRRVTQVDDTGAQSLVKICRNAHELGLERIAIAGSTDVVRVEFERYLQQEAFKNIVDVEEHLDNILEIYETKLLAATDPEDPNKFLEQRFGDIHVWEQIKSASGHERQLEDGEELYRPGSEVKGQFYVISSGILAMETRSAKDSSAKIIPQRSTEYDPRSQEDHRVWTSSAIYSAPCAIGISPYFLKAPRHGFRMVARGPATIHVFTKEDLAAFRQRDPQLYITFLEDFCCYWSSTETNQLRWRCALNQ